MMKETESKQLLEEVLDLLWEQHGREEVDGDDDILGVLVRTVLSQSTNNANSRRAFDGLLDRFHGDWGAIERAPAEEVAKSIEVGGLANQKAPRIQAILKRAREDGADDEHSLEFLRDRPTSDALAYLSSLRGVGPKTARFTMMYAAGADVFPMDTHIFRILERLGILVASKSDRAAHEYAEELVPDGEAYPAHMVLVKHGRELCHARIPNCEACAVSDLCASSSV